MRKRFYLPLALLAALVGCQKELESPENDSIVPVIDSFYAEIEPSVESKTYIDDFNNVRWQKGDQVAAFLNNTVAQKYQIEDQADGQTGGNFNLINGEGLSGGTETAVSIAYYPYCPSLSIEAAAGGAYVLKGVNLPAVQQYDPVHAVAQHTLPMIAASKDQDCVLAFKNLCGVLEFSVKGQGNIRYIYLKGNDREPLAGKVTIEVVPGSLPVLSMGASFEDRIILDLGSKGIELDPVSPRRFMIAVPPTTFPNGFELTLLDKEGKGMVQKTSQLWEIKRSCILKMNPTLDFTASAQPVAPLPELFDGQVPDTEIWYKTSDRKVLPFEETELSDVKLVSNVYSDKMGVLTFDGPVRKIKSSWFRGEQRLTAVNLPASVVSIESFGFKGCSSLRQVILKNSGVKAIGDHAFAGCSVLDDISFSSRLGTIGQYAFEDCGALREVVLPESLNNMQEGTFMNCRGLQKISLPKNLNEIREKTFMNCSALEKIDLSYIYNEIASQAFKGCSSLFAVQLSDEGSYGWLGPEVFAGCISLRDIDFSKIVNVSSGTFFRCESLKDASAHPLQITVDHSTNGVRLGAFEGCISLERVRLVADGGYGGSEIPDRTFLGCKSLKELPDLSRISSVGANAFQGCEGLREIRIGTNCSIGRNAFDGCCADVYLTDELVQLQLQQRDFIQRIFGRGSYVFHLPEGFTTLDDNLFNGYEGVVGLYFPSSFKKVVTEENHESNRWVPSPLNKLPNLQSVHLAEGITEIHGSAFLNCRQLQEIHLPSTVIKIGPDAFNSCCSLLSIDLPEHLVDLGKGAFDGCISLSEIDIPSGITAIPDNCFSSCSFLNRISLPSGLQSIGIMAFGWCEELEEVVLPDGVQSIGAGAFRHCDKLRSINLSGNTSVGGAAFNWCDRLSSDIPGFDPQRRTLVRNGELVSIMVTDSTVTADIIPEGVKKIGTGVFCEAYDLTEIILPESLEVIGDRAFMYASLEKVSFPQHVKSIEPEAFYGNSLSEVVFTSPVAPVVAEDAFDVQEKFVFVPSSALDSYRSITGLHADARHFVGYELMADGAMCCFVEVGQFLEMGLPENSWCRLSGTIQSISDPVNGVLELKDDTGVVTINGLTQNRVSVNDQSFVNLNLKIGDVLTVICRKDNSQNPPQAVQAYYVQK